MTNEMNEGIKLGICLTLVVEAVLFLGSCLARFDSAKSSYAPVVSEITVKEHYAGLSTKKEAFDKCMKLVESNGYVVHEAKTINVGGKTFAAIIGRAYAKKTED